MMRTQTDNYYSVTCKCGHVGRNNYIPISFAVKASNGKDAAERAKWFPRVKHHHKDCIIDVSDISYREYVALLSKNNKDPYLKCRSIQEQNRHDLENRIFSEQQTKQKSENKTIQKHPSCDGKKIIRNPKKYIRLNYFADSYAY